MKQIATGLKADEGDQESMRTLLKAQRRWLFDAATPSSTNTHVTPLRPDRKQPQSRSDVKRNSRPSLRVPVPCRMNRFLLSSVPLRRSLLTSQYATMSTGRSSVTVQRSRLAYADTIGDEHLRGKLLGLGPILQRLDNFGGAVAENAISKKVAMAALEHLELVSPVFHGDVVRFEGELINIGRSSLTLQVTGYRHDIKTREFAHVLDAVMTAVALDENNRPFRGLPELVDPSNENRMDQLKDAAQQRKDLSMRLKRLEESVDQSPNISPDILSESIRGEWADEVSVQDTVVALSTSFLPRHLNRNGTVFGGEILSWMDKTALYCGRMFTGNGNMVTMSASQVSFKLPITTDDVVTMEARVCGVREHYVDVEVEVFLKKFASQERRKSHTGYFSVANLDASERVDCVTRGLVASEQDQSSLRTMLKAQHRRRIHEEEQTLHQLQPLGLSSIPGSHL